MKEGALSFGSGSDGATRVELFSHVTCNNLAYYGAMF
jgi:hypothetical protein